jgi:branched-chain amino acid transport system permease protein
VDGVNFGQIPVQVFNGLVTGSFYALLSLGLAIIFGMLRVVNFAHGTAYTLGAFIAYLLLQQFGIGFWPALIVAPLLVGVLGMGLERTLIRRLYSIDPLYNFLLTFGLALITQDALRLRFGVQGQPYRSPAELGGVTFLGTLAYPNYRLFVIVFSVVVCLLVWFAIERTRIGMVVRAAIEKPELTRALGVDVDRWITPLFGFGVALAALGGVLAAAMRNVSPLMGADLIITVFAVVVIGGLGSILGSIVAGFLVGVLSAMGAVFYPPLANTLVFILMAIVLLARPAGLFGTAESA